MSCKGNVANPTSMSLQQMSSFISQSPMFILTCIKTLHQSQVLKEDATELQLGYNENMSLFFFFSVFYFFIFLFFNIFFFICGGFCHTFKLNSQGFTCVPHVNMSLKAYVHWTKLLTIANIQNTWLSPLLGKESFVTFCPHSPKPVV